jgi:tetratricopeptide (TPR) repeat protein
MGDRQPDREARYRAFLSYSHKDAAAARALHRRLESYRLPKRLVGTQGAHGVVPERLSPIFRDREELPAAGDLSQTVRAALARSDALIVLCSPSAAASLWVGLEVALFRKLHPGRPIYAAIVAGEPSQAFPAALTAGGTVEPLAADLRAKGDGRRLGLLKLAAGLSGVGLDALVQRDAQRRIRRVTAVTAAALAAMLAMAVLTTAALTARADAERQRAEAEGLVEFMLTDLRRELRGVGRLDIMSTVNQRALTHYERQRDRDPTVATSAVRARVDHTMGEDLLTRGDAEAALRLFRNAHRISSQLIEQSPADPQAIFVHAQSEFWLGRVDEVRQDWAGAQRRYARFAGLIDKLIASAPDNPEYMMQVGWSALDLGNIQLNGTKDYAAAQRSYEKAVHWFGRALEAMPRDEGVLRAQANAYAWLADSFFMRAMWRESLAARLRQFRIVERLHRASPANVENSYRLALAERAIARAYFKEGEKASARRLLFRAFDRARQLEARDPGNGEWRLFGGLVRCDLYWAGLGTPKGVTRPGLRDEIVSVTTALASAENPRIAELSNCVAAIG